MVWTKFFLIFAVFLSLFGCENKEGKKAVEEDLVAKKELQGIWINEDGEDVAFRIKGDSVYFPDTTSAPMYFRVEADSFVLLGVNTVKYKILKRAPHLFEFINQSGEDVKLVKTDDESYLNVFEQKPKMTEVNQQRLLKRDTVLHYNGEKYHCYVQVNPTTYKVIKATFNDDGVEVDNVYYDNIIHFSVFNGDRKIFSSNLTKQDFAGYVPAQFLKQAVFSDMTYSGIDKDGVHYFAILAIPDSYSSYMVEFIVSYNGKVTKRIRPGQASNAN